MATDAQLAQLRVALDRARSKVTDEHAAEEARRAMFEGQVYATDRARRQAVATLELLSRKCQCSAASPETRLQCEIAALEADWYMRIVMAMRDKSQFPDIRAAAARALASSQPIGKGASDGWGTAQQAWIVAKPLLWIARVVLGR